MELEILAVADISRRLALCLRLSPFVASGDKTPFTDGHVDVYDGGGRSKDHWQGRVSIQVKGRRLNAKGKAKTTFRIARQDLLAYQQQGGVVFFVVYLHPKSGIATPLYRILSPFGVRDILDAVPETQSTITVALSALPDEPSHLERIMDMAVRMQDQRISVGFDSSLFEAAESMTLHFTNYPNFDAPVTFSSADGESALVLNLHGGLSLPVPGKLTVFPSSYLPQEVIVSVRAGDIVYDRATTRQISDTAFELELSSGIKIVTDRAEGSRSTTVALTPSDNLIERLKDISFYLAISEERELLIDGRRTPFEFVDDPNDEQLREHVGTLRAVGELFTVLRIDPALIRLTDVTDAQLRAMQFMHMSLVEGHDLHATKAEPGLLYETVGSDYVALLVLPGAEPDTWRYADPFDSTNQHLFRVYVRGETATREPRSATAYEGIARDDLRNILNLHLDEVVVPYAAISDLPDTVTLANLNVLALITAADARVDRSEEFLRAAETLNDWLIATDGEEPHHLINRWQILARRDQLAMEERDAIRDMRRSLARNAHERADEIDAHCAILLGDAEDIAHSLRRLPETKLSEIESWPIWSLRESEQR